MTKTFKFDLFGEILPAIRSKNIAYFEAISEEDWKHITPFVLMKWVSYTNDPYSIMTINKYLNESVFDLGAKHKLSLIKVLMVCNNTKKRPKWIKQKPSSRFPNTINVIKEYYKLSNRHARDTIARLSNTDILGCAQALAYEPAKIKKLKNELKTR